MVFNFHISRNGLVTEPFEGLEVEVDVENRMLSFRKGVVIESVGFCKNYGISFNGNSFVIKYREKDGPTGMIFDARDIINALNRIGYVSVPKTEMRDAYTLNFIFPDDVKVSRK